MSRTPTSQKPTQALNLNRHTHCLRDRGLYPPTTHTLATTLRLQLEVPIFIRNNNSF